jgi:hypothetical protein
MEKRELRSAVHRAGMAAPTLPPSAALVALTAVAVVVAGLAAPVAVAAALAGVVPAYAKSTLRSAPVVELEASAVAAVAG